MLKKIKLSKLKGEKWSQHEALAIKYGFGGLQEFRIN